jgi:hypothetical protein
MRKLFANVPVTQAGCDLGGLDPGHVIRNARSAVASQRCAASLRQGSLTGTGLMRSLFLVAFGLLIAGTFQACASQMHFAQTNALSNGKIKIGMSRGEVIAYLGSPQKTETVGSTEFLSYTPIWYVLPVFVSSQNPIAIRDGKVVGMGKSHYDSVVQATGSVKGAM